MIIYVPILTDVLPPTQQSPNRDGNNMTIRTGTVTSRFGFRNYNLMT